MANENQAKGRISRDPRADIITDSNISTKSVREKERVLQKWMPEPGEETLSDSLILDNSWVPGRLVFWNFFIPNCSMLRKISSLL